MNKIKTNIYSSIKQLDEYTGKNGYILGAAIIVIFGILLIIFNL